MAKLGDRPLTVAPLTDEMFDEARASAKREEPIDVTSARYDRKSDAIRLRLRSGIAIELPRSQIRELADVRPSDIKKVHVQPGGDGISIWELDVDIYVPGLLTDLLGSMFARALGRRSRGRTSQKKALASRANGRKGGRPKNVAVR